MAHRARARDINATPVRYRECTYARAGTWPRLGATKRTAGTSEEADGEHAGALACCGGGRRGSVRCCGRPVEGSAAREVI